MKKHGGVRSVVSTSGSFDEDVFESGSDVEASGL